MQTAMRATDRQVLRVSGADWRKFMGDLVSNSLAGLEGGAVYAALLTPQGKYLFDFFLIGDGDGVLLDVKAERAAALLQRLTLYRLRSKVEISPSEIEVAQVFGVAPEIGKTVADPRHPALGWRVYGVDLAAQLAEIAPASADDWAALRVEHLVPETEVELIADQSYILEMGFERLRGVDFRKGCYVGQEVTARMKHKTELRKGLARVRLLGQAEPGTAITVDERAVGTLHTVAGDRALAYLRLARLEGEIRAGDAIVTLD